MRGAADDTLLEWAAANGRVMVSHDVNTMTAAANLRIAQGLAMSGLIIVPQWLSIAAAIDQLQYIADVNSPGEMANGTFWLPI